MRIRENTRETVKLVTRKVKDGKEREGERGGGTTFINLLISGSVLLVNHNDINLNILKLY